MDGETRDWLVSEGVAPLQGIEEALNAMAGAACMVSSDPVCLRARVKFLRSLHGVSPHRGKARRSTNMQQKTCSASGVCRFQTGSVSPGRTPPSGRKTRVSRRTKNDQRKDRPQVRSAGGPDWLASAKEVQQGVEKMRRDVKNHAPDAVTDRFLVEAMAPAPVCEMLVSIRRDPQFGFAMTLASAACWWNLSATLKLCCCLRTVPKSSAHWII